MKDLIKRLTEAYGPSGREEQIRDLIHAEIESLSDEVHLDAMGNLIVVKRGSGSGKTVMLAAHMDEIGLIVSYVDNQGFLRCQPIGGVDLMTLLGSRVRFADGSYGVIYAENRQEFSKDPAMDKLYIDVGASSRREAEVRLGESVSFVRTFVDMGQTMIAKAFDDRIGCAVLIGTLRALGESPHDIAFVFTVQEEVGLRGARTSAYGVNPDLGISVDVTLAADTPEAPKLAMKLGAGPCIKVMDSGMLAHPGVKDLLIKTAEEHSIPFQLEVLARGTTDAAAIQLTRAGIPAGCVSIACRYVHSPSEMVHIEDVQNAISLLAAMLRQPIEL